MRMSSKVPHHLSETRAFIKVRSKSVVEAEPSELHFNGFEVGKHYKKIVKVINISPDVIHVHVLPTQSKYFQTEYEQKTRLVPGLALSITVRFLPNEWRYFFDSIQIHCEGEEKLQVTIHAYPVTDDLDIPSRINLFPVPLGHSSTCVIPLSCSCPVGFEFQVHCLKSHEAFSIYPLSGIIPAKGKTDLSVTFTPQQYGTAETTLQLNISQFNLKPFTCTLTASCPPNLTLSQQREYENDAKNLRTKEVMDRIVPKPKAKATPKIEKHSKKMKPEPYMQKYDGDLSSHGRLAKMLIQHQEKLSNKDLTEDMRYIETSYQTRQRKEAAFENRLRVNSHRHLQRQVQVGDDPLSTEDKIKILKEQEVAASAYMINKNMATREMGVAQVSPKLSSHRVVRCVGQGPDCSPVFSIYGSSQLEVRLRALRLFQQIARKVILQVRLSKRLRLLRKLVCRTKKEVGGEKSDDINEKPDILNMSSVKLLPSVSPVVPSSNQLCTLVTNKVDVGPIEADLTSTIPFFNLKVPQHYKLMGYQEVPVYDSRTFFIHKPLRTGAQNELLPSVMCPDPDTWKEKQLQEDETPERKLSPQLCFKAPRHVLKPRNLYPFKIFNPAPSVYAFRPKPLYLESEPEVHLCPLTRRTTWKDGAEEVHKNDRDDVLKGVMIWKTFPCLALNTVSALPAQTSSRNSSMRDPFSGLMLLQEAPLSLKDLPDNIKKEISFGDDDAPGIRLNPDMVQAEFAALENGSFKTCKEDSMNDQETVSATALPEG